LNCFSSSIIFSKGAYTLSFATSTCKTLVCMTWRIYMIPSALLDGLSLDLRT